MLAQLRSKLLILFLYLAAALILTGGYRAKTAMGDMRHSPALAWDHCNGSFIQYSQGYAPRRCLSSVHLTL